MKKLLLLIIFSFSPSLIFPQQLYYTFSELNGMEDNLGNTHLFYRLYNYQKGGGPLSDSHDNSIYHLNLGNNSDSLFLYSGKNYSDFSYVVLDIEFWNNDPSKYIYCGAQGYTDGTAFIQRYDQDKSSVDELGGASAIEISNQNDSLIFASVNSILLKSINGGIVWDTVNSNSYARLISVNPFSDSIIFTDNFSGFYKSIDGGTTFSLVDTFYTNDNNANPLNYDKDQIHIYRIINFKGECFLSVSNDKGNAFSWTQKYSSTNKLLIGVDNSQSGSIYLADKNYIYYSNDYGENFSTYKKLDHNIVGIYKKPNSNKLYAATKYNLYEITPDSIKTIKHLQIDPEIFSWFPLHVGDKWVYHASTSHGDPREENFDGDIVKTVTGKEVKENGKEYFAINENNSSYYFERIDTLSGKIFRYNDYTLNYPQPEYEVFDLLAEIGDTIHGYFNGSAVLIDEGYLSKWDIQNQYKRFNEFLNIEEFNYILIYDFGVDSTSFSFDFGYSTSYLKGAVINGIVYGDTTLTATEESEKIPTSFSLLQNYPNPFNPTTKIKYSVPNVETRHASSVQVTLKVYDILGREIVILVNQEQGPGNYEVEFTGNGFPSGIYFYKLSAGDFHQTKKMILLK